MSPSEQASPQGQAGAETQAGSLLDEIVSKGFSAQVERSRAEELLGALVGEALQGTLTFDKNVTKTIRAGMDLIDQALSRQLAAIMHNPAFQKLEGTWRGLHYLVMNTETS